MTQENRRLRSAGRMLVLGCLWAVVAGATAWAFGALYFDFPALPHFVAVLYFVGVAGAIVWLKGMKRKLGVAYVGFFLVLAWWFTQQPSNQRNWERDQAKLAWAEVNGDVVTLHNVRNCDYRTETDYTVRWETRTVRLSEITGMDLFITNWGSPWMAHPIASFTSTGEEPICFSIETRKEVGEKYSAIGGFYRQYELVYTVADERDVIRLRTNYRKDENVYLYHTNCLPEHASKRFLAYVNTLNGLRQSPRWYNALTTNCTTAIRTQNPASERIPWDWRLLANGKGDEMLYERRDIAADGQSFADLKKQAWINPAAKAADKSPDFWRMVREGRPGFPEFAMAGILVGHALSHP